MKRKFRESWIAAGLLIVCIICVAFGLIRLFQPVRLPIEGVWYCAELNTTIDCSAQPNTITISSGSSIETWTLLCDYAGRCYIADNENPSVTVKYGALVQLNIFQKDIIVIRLDSDQTKYVFRYLQDFSG